MADPRVSEDVKCQMRRKHDSLDPVRLLKDIRAEQGRLVQLADAPEIASTVEQPTLEQFLTGLRTAWLEKEVRPTARPKARRPRKKRKTPDPFGAVSEKLRGWFEAEPWRTSRELLERLQSEHVDSYSDGQLRTLQRRVKEWRRETAHQMVFGTTPASGDFGIDA
jgi:hypothetical protein